MTQPAGTIKASPMCWLSYLSLEDAARALPASKFYKICVSTHRLFDAYRLLGKYIGEAENNPLVPTIGIDIDYSFKGSEWCLWSGDQGIWHDNF